MASSTRRLSTSLAIGELFDLTDHVAIVTGGALGIGQSIGYRLAEAGAIIVIADVNLDAAHDTVHEITARGGRAMAVRADAGRVGDAQSVARQTVTARGRLDILVNNAGIFPFIPALNVTEEQWDRILGINLKGSFFSAQAAAEQMIAAGRGGRIVNIASMHALQPTGDLAPYDASKAGMVMLTRSLALEFGRHRITVNAIAPGGIDTPGGAAATEAVRQAAGVDAEDVSRGFLARVPLGRMGVPDDIALATLFLVSRAADYITGSMLLVDGGYLLG